MSARAAAFHRGGAERAGGLLFDRAAFGEISDTLNSVDFYRHEHTIFAAIAQMIGDCKPVDIITVFEQLQGIGKAEEVGGLLATSTPWRLASSALRT